MQLKNNFLIYAVLKQLGYDGLAEDIRLFELKTQLGRTWRHQVEEVPIKQKGSRRKKLPNNTESLVWIAADYCHSQGHYLVSQWIQNLLNSERTVAILYRANLAGIYWRCGFCALFEYENLFPIDRSYLSVGEACLAGIDRGLMVIIMEERYQEWITRNWAIFHREPTS